MRAIGIISITVFGLFYQGVVVVTLWHWFVVPVGVPSIGLPHAIGLSLVVDAFLGSRGMVADVAAYQDARDKDFLSFAFRIMVPSFLLAAGFFTKGMMP